MMAKNQAATHWRMPTGCSLVFCVRGVADHEEGFLRACRRRCMFILDTYKFLCVVKYSASPVLSVVPEEYGFPVFLPEKYKK